MTIKHHKVLSYLIVVQEFIYVLYVCAQLLIELDPLRPRFIRVTFAAATQTPTMSIKDSCERRLIRQYDKKKVAMLSVNCYKRRINFTDIAIEPLFLHQFNPPAAAANEVNSVWIDREREG